MSMHTSIDLSVYMSLHMSIHMSINISIHMSIHISIQMSLHMSIHMFIHMSIHLYCSDVQRSTAVYSFVVYICSVLKQEVDYLPSRARSTHTGHNYIGP